MDAAGRAERIISDALARGDLTPREGVGEPLGDLDDDPDWWVRSWLAREAIPDRFAAVCATHDGLLSDAVTADDLAAAREILAAANAIADSWNEGAPASHRLPSRSEVWLIDRRAGRPAD